MIILTDCCCIVPGMISLSSFEGLAILRMKGALLWIRKGQKRRSPSEAVMIGRAKWRSNIDRAMA
jgi:hypothetical protein